MKNILTISLVLISSIGFSQSIDNGKIQLEGIWTLTNYNNPEEFEDIWEFRPDSTFNELKYKADGDRTLVPDENGTWTLADNKLKITVTGEDIRREYKLYEKPQVLEFEISKEGNDLILTVVNDSGASDAKTTRLRLTKN